MVIVLLIFVEELNTQINVWFGLILNPFDKDRKGKAIWLFSFFQFLKDFIGGVEFVMVAIKIYDNVKDLKVFLNFHVIHDFHDFIQEPC